MVARLVLGFRTRTTRSVARVLSQALARSRQSGRDTSATRERRPGRRSMRRQCAELLELKVEQSAKPEKGFEPLAPALQERCSDQLSYSGAVLPIVEARGGEDVLLTPDTGPPTSVSGPATRARNAPQARGSGLRAGLRRRPPARRLRRGSRSGRASPGVERAARRPRARRASRRRRRAHRAPRRR